jgi:hypothetical protein
MRIQPALDLLSFVVPEDADHAGLHVPAIAASAIVLTAQACWSLAKTSLRPRQCEPMQARGPRPRGT